MKKDADKNGEPKEIHMPTDDEMNELTKARKAFSTLGFGLFSIVVIATLAQLICGLAFRKWTSTWWGVWVFTYLPIYVVALPLSLGHFRKVPVSGRAGNGGASYGPGQMVRWFCLAIFMQEVGTVVGSAVASLASTKKVADQASDYLITNYLQADSLVLEILFVAVLAPIFEEFVFRKLLIDRMSRYGQRLAVVASALLFGLFHCSYSQFFYTFSVGLVFGYIYLKSGKLRYSVGVHMALNLMGILAGVSLLGFTAVEDSLGNLSTAQIMELIPFFACIAVEVLCLIAGLVFFCLGIRRVSFERAELELPKGTKLKTVFLNAGIILYALACIAFTVMPGIF